MTYKEVVAIVGQIHNVDKCQVTMCVPVIMLKSSCCCCSGHPKNNFGWLIGTSGEGTNFKRYIIKHKYKPYINNAKYHSRECFHYVGSNFYINTNGKYNNLIL